MAIQQKGTYNILILHKQKKSDPMDEVKDKIQDMHAQVLNQMLGVKNSAHMNHITKEADRRDSGDKNYATQKKLTCTMSLKQHVAFVHVQDLVIPVPDNITTKSFLIKIYSKFNPADITLYDEYNKKLTLEICIIYPKFVVNIARDNGSIKFKLSCGAYRKVMELQSWKDLPLYLDEIPLKNLLVDSITITPIIHEDDEKEMMDINPYDHSFLVEKKWQSFYENSQNASHPNYITNALVTKVHVLKF